MPNIQGHWPKSSVPGSKMVGKDQNGRYVTNVNDYRGRPYCVADLIDQKALDYDREVSKQSRQAGLRFVGVMLTTSQINPSHYED